MDQRCGQVAEDFPSTWSALAEQTLLKMLASSPNEHFESFDLVPNIPDLNEVFTRTVLDRFP